MLAFLAVRAFSCSEMSTASDPMLKLLEIFSASESRELTLHEVSPAPNPRLRRNTIYRTYPPAPSLPTCALTTMTVGLYCWHQLSAALQDLGLGSDDALQELLLRKFFAGSRPVLSVSPVAFLDHSHGRALLCRVTCDGPVHIAS